MKPSLQALGAPVLDKASYHVDKKRVRRSKLNIDRRKRKHPMRFAAALLVFFYHLASVATAQEIPEYDTQASCERRAGTDRQDNRFTSCLMVEDYALAELEDYWPRANQTQRFECIEEANPTERYAVLASCLMARIRKERRR